MTDNQNRLIRVRERVLRVLLEDAWQTLDAYAQDEYGQRLAEATSECYGAIQAADRAAAALTGSGQEPGADETIIQTLADAHACTENAGDRELCQRIDDAKARLEEARLREVSLSEAIQSGDNERVAEVMRMARGGEVVRII